MIYGCNLEKKGLKRYHKHILWTTSRFSTGDAKTNFSYRCSYMPDAAKKQKHGRRDIIRVLFCFTLFAELPNKHFPVLHYIRIKHSYMFCLFYNESPCLLFYIFLGYDLLCE